MITLESSEKFWKCEAAPSSSNRTSNTSSSDQQWMTPIPLLFPLKSAATNNLLCSFHIGVGHNQLSILGDQALHATDTSWCITTNCIFVRLFWQCWKSHHGSAVVSSTTWTIRNQIFSMFRLLTWKDDSFRARLSGSSPNVWSVSCVGNNGFAHHATSSSENLFALKTFMNKTQESSISSQIEQRRFCEVHAEMWWPLEGIRQNRRRSFFLSFVWEQLFTSMKTSA